MLLNHAGATCSGSTSGRGTVQSPIDLRQAINWTETAGIKWCSDGRSPDWLPPSKSPFGPGTTKAAQLYRATGPLRRASQRGEALYARQAVWGLLGTRLQTTAARRQRTRRSVAFVPAALIKKPACNSDPSCTGTRCFQKFPPPPPPPPPPTANLTVAVGRRPYVMESTGHVLVRITASSPGTKAISGGSCSVSAVLVGSETVLSNGTWALRLEEVAAAPSPDGFVTSFPFSLQELPASIDDSLNVTIDCPTLGWRTERFRSFQRAPAAGAPKRSLSQVDHFTRSLRVDGEPFLSVGWYYSIFDNGERNLTEFVAEQARAGVNTCFYTRFPS